MNISTPTSISDARANLPDLVDWVSTYSDRIVITVNGKPKATLVSTEELESLEETAEVMAIPRIKEDLERSRKQIQKGQYIPLSDLK